MSAVEELSVEIEEKERTIREKIRNAEMRLGATAIKYKEMLGLHVGGRLLEAALEASSFVCEAEAADRNTKIFLEEFRKDQSDLEDKLNDEKAREAELRRLSIRLGAMIYEQCSFSLLDKEAYRVVYDDVEEDRKLEKDSSGTFLSKILGSGKARMRKMGEEGRFISYSEIAVKSGSPVDGENAVSMLNMIVSLQEKKVQEEKEIDALQKKIADSREKARTAEKGIPGSDDNIRKLRKNEEEAVVSYGSYLYDKGAEWVDKDTPSDILDLLEELLHLHGEHDEVLSEKERLDREAKADDYRAMIESEEGKIMVLEKEKERIDREIAEIKKEIEVLRMRIERLGR